MSRFVPDYDLAVIGGGSAGLTAAALGAALGAKTILIERDRLGGECTWTGCVPSKALLRAAQAAHEVRAAGRFGLATTLTVDFARVMSRVREVRREIYERADSPLRLRRYGVETVAASARFVDRGTLALEGGSRLRARWIVIATGSAPRALDLGVPVLDNETVWTLERLPARLLIVGAGPVGIETAQAFARLGSEVTVVGEEDRPLVRDDAETAAVVERRLRDDGVRFALGTRVASAAASSGGIEAVLADGRRLVADRIFAAVGRVPRIAELGLDAAGVAVRDGRIAIDRRCRTAARNIYACGDVATTARFTHVAERMSFVAVMHAIAKYPARFAEDEITWVTFTDPELASAGATEADLARRRIPHRVERFSYADLDRASTDDAGDGLVKIVTSPRGAILGASIAGARAGEVMSEVQLARRHGLRIDAVSQTLHAYPTYGMAARRAADAAVMRARTPLVLRALKAFRGLRGTPPSLDTLRS